MGRAWTVALVLGAPLWLAAGDASVSREPAPIEWSEDELRTLRSLTIRRLGRVPYAPGNRFSESSAAAELGHRLFFDTDLSDPPGVACATCHRPELYFTDGLARSRGHRETLRGAPTVVGAAYSPWQYWDGRRDSLWSQALVPLEHEAEMATTRMQLVRRIAGDPGYREAYGAIFGALPGFADPERFPAQASPRGTPKQRAAWGRMAAPDREAVNVTFANVGKALAAYQRRLRPAPARFDRYVASLEGRGSPSGELTREELEGLRLFISPETQCLRCHNGPLLTNHGFHNTGAPQSDPDVPDLGRQAAIRTVLEDPFNCLGPYSDARPEQCAELNFIKTEGSELPGAFKVPTLRGVTRTAPYFHNGAFASLAEVLDHYNRPRPAVGHLELSPLGLSEVELKRIEAFLGTLDSPLAEPRWARPPRPPR